MIDRTKFPQSRKIDPNNEIFNFFADTIFKKFKKEIQSSRGGYDFGKFYQKLTKWLFTAKLRKSYIGWIR